MNRIAWLVVVAALCGCGAHRPPVLTTTLSAATDTLPDELEASSEPKRYRFPTPGSGIDTGAAVVAVEAPIDEVLRIVQDYASYSRILPRLSDSRVVGKKGDTSDVYLRAPVLDGVTHIWAVVRFSPPKAFGDGGSKLSGRLVKGNLEAWRGAWKLEPDGPSRTILRLELFIDVKLPVPDAWVTPELMWAAEKGVVAVRDMAERGESSVSAD